MCGIAGVFNSPHAERYSSVMSKLIRHRGPDDSRSWSTRGGSVALAHRRLSIIDVESGHQPMSSESGNCIAFNGEIYNYRELAGELGEGSLSTRSDTEVLLKAYEKWGEGCLDKLRGMFAFAIWDEAEGRMFCARDRFGIKPFYYCTAGDTVFFASEVKALLPFLREISTDEDALLDYLTFQFCMPGKTLFAGVSELPPGHMLTIGPSGVRQTRYWDIHYEHDRDHNGRWFERRLDELVAESVSYHLRSDVPVGAYVSGGIDSSLMATLGARASDGEFCGFNGRFPWSSDYDESAYAQEVCDAAGFPLHICDIGADDFAENISKVIYHLDYPVAGPGSFPQYMVSELAARHRKVVLGGQGGDEIFGGYTRYLIAYFEQCIKAAIDGTSNDGNFVVTYESIIPNLASLRNYKPLIRQFWKDGLFGAMDQRYFRLINRAPHLGPLISWDSLPEGGAFERFQAIFNADNVGKQSYFDLMTHFDFKTLLPALLQVEDRMSMAHGLESRVPLLDHPLVEFAATAPADIKFPNGDLKHLLKRNSAKALPENVVNRTDKMGFPTPLNEWLAGPLRDFACDIFSSEAARGRGFVDNGAALKCLEGETKYGRNLWGLMCLELWQREFHDQAQKYRDYLSTE